MQRQYHHNITLKPLKKKGTQGKNTFTTNQNTYLNLYSSLLSTLLPTTQL